MYVAAHIDIIAAQEDAAIAPHRCSFVLLVLVLSSPAGAAELVGQVVGVADGDTLTLLDASHEKYRVRLSGIDAPEKRQAYGERAKQHLSTLVFRKTVRVVWERRDRYSRIIGRVLWNNLFDVAGKGKRNSSVR